MDESTDTENDGQNTGYYETDPDTGRLVEQYTDDQFAETVHDLEVASTGDVARELDCTRRTARERLKKLATEGQIEKLESGAGFTWLPAEEKANSD